MLSIAAAIMVASTQFYLPEHLLDSVCFVESSNRPLVVHKDDGPEDSIGLCQIHISTARQMGFKGSKSGLLNPETNAYYAAKYLSYQINRYHGSIYRAIAAYNAGTYKENAKGTARNQRYVNKVLSQYSMSLKRHYYIKRVVGQS